MPLGNRNKIIAGCGAHHVTIQARNWEDSLHLYRDVLGMIPTAEFGPPDRRIVLLDMGDGSHIELIEPTPDTPLPGSAATNDPIVHIGLASTDARAAAEHVRDAGFEITVEPKDVDLNGLNVTVAFFKGPSGEVIEFFETH